VPGSDSVTRRRFLSRALKIGATGLAAPQVAGLAAQAAEPARNAAWQIGCYTRPWDSHDYRVALDAIAEAGFKYAGLMTTKSETRLVISTATTPEEAGRIGEEVKKRGLQIASVYGGEFPVDRSLQAGIDGLRKLIDNCAAAGAPSLLLGGTGDTKLYEPYYKAVAECCDYAAGKRVALALKPHGGLNATGPQCRKAIEQVGHRNFRLWYDPGNIYYYSDGKLNPVDDAATVDGLVTGMCVKDYKDPKNVMVTPGAGQVNFGVVLARLKQGGFAQGPLVIETLEAGELPKLLEQARKAREFVEGLTHP